MATTARSTKLAALPLIALFAMNPLSSAVAAKECKDGHWHHGASSGSPAKSKKIALKEAILSWREFTAYEYGISWAYFNNAADRQINCTPHAGNRWSCTVDARPCNRRR